MRWMVVYEYEVPGGTLNPKQELSLDEAMIPWWGRLAFRTYNPGGKKRNMDYW
jgi:hypothetical protein